MVEGSKAKTANTVSSSDDIPIIQKATKVMPKNIIGDMNGLWQLLLKVQLVLTPILFTGFVTWATWVTSSIYRIEPNSRSIEVLSKIMERHEDQPGHRVMESRMTRIETKMDLIYGRLEKIYQRLDETGK